MATSMVKEIFDRGTATFNAHDIDAFGETMADDVQLRASGTPALSGKEAVKAFFRSWVEAFPDARVNVNALHILEDCGIAEAVFSGTQRGTLHTKDGDLPPTGRAVRVEYMQVVDARGDRVASFHLVFDRADLLEQLGLAPSVATGTGVYRAASPEATLPH